MRACNCGTLKPCDFHNQLTKETSMKDEDSCFFFHGDDSVAIVQGPHRGRWGYVDATDGANVRVHLASSPADRYVTVPAGCLQLMKLKG